MGIRLLDVYALIEEKLLPIDISGKYSVNSTAETVTIEQKGIDCLISSTAGWKSVGHIIGNIYSGIYEYPGDGIGEHLMLIKKDKNLVGIWQSEKYGSGKIEWIRKDQKYVPQPRTEQQTNKNKSFEK